MYNSSVLFSMFRQGKAISGDVPPHASIDLILTHTHTHTRTRNLHAHHIRPQPAEISLHVILNPCNTQTSLYAIDE